MEANLKIGPKVGYFNVVLASFAHFCGDFYCNILPVLLPIFALKYGFSYSQCGLLYMIFQVTASFLQAPIGLYADKKNLGFILPLSILTSGVLASCVGLTDSPVVLVIIIFLSGLCSSGFHPIAGGIIPHISPKDKGVLSTSIFIVGGNVGFAIAPFITALYLEVFEVEHLAYLAIIPLLTTVMVVIRRLHVKTWQPKPSETLNLKIIFHNKSFLYLVASIGLRSVCYCALVIYIPLLFTSRGISSVSASAILMTMLIGTAVGGLVIGLIAHRFRMKTLIILSYVLTIAMMIVFLIKADDSILSFICIFTAGFGLYGSTPVAIVLAQRLLPHADSFATSMMLGFTFGIGYILSVFIGILADFVGLHEALSIFIFPSLILAILTVLKVNTVKAV